MMRTTSIFLIGIFATQAAAGITNSKFEPKSFNVTEALGRIGIPASRLPKPNFEGELLRERSLFAPCSLACASLTILFDKDQILTEGSSPYDAFTATYWSAQQGAVSPTCVFKPAKTSEVSIVVLISRLYQCPFAVKGGGHAAWAGASSIEGGITISLENFKQANVSADKTTVDIGPGLTWLDVYSAVEKHGLSVVGGRMAPVGASGLILGGGISHFASRRGWACDNVESYELVTASGLILDVTVGSYPDLYWALRGGGNNFGIVTNFKLAAFPLGQMWLSQRLYLEPNFPKVLDAIYEFAVTASTKDPDAAEFVTIAPYPGYGKVMFTNLHYAKPVSNAPVFNYWKNITFVQDTNSLRTMSGMANLLNEGAPAPGAYQAFWGISLKMDRLLLDFIVGTFFNEVATLVDVEQILQVMAIQPITEGALKAMQKNGGNALGLDPKNGPYFVLNFNSAWDNKEDEPKFQKAISKIIDTVKAEARSRGLDNDFIYMNYASQYQDPIGSYGSANRQRLVEISKKYDPTQVFQYLQSSGFKLAKGAPTPRAP